MVLCGKWGGRKILLVSEWELNAPFHGEWPGRYFGSSLVQIQDDVGS